MEVSDNENQFIIVNRSTEHRISKKLIRKIPYFAKMLSPDYLEAKGNKIILDFDEQAFKSILNCVEFGLMLIDMKNAISICNLIDYFGIDDHVLDDCATYFHNNFTIEHLSIVIPQVKQTSKFMNSGVLNAFICRYFLKIVNTNVWLDYPIETIEYICALDLMVHSEVQVFNAIKKWVNFKVDSRNCYVERLLQLVRWCYLKDEELSVIKSDVFFGSTNMQPIFWFNREEDCVRIHNRADQNHFIAIEELDGTDLQIKVLDNNFQQLFNQVLKLDESMSANIFHDEHVSIIFFDSGRNGIQIDWNASKYRFLDFAFVKSYYIKMHKYIFKQDGASSTGQYTIKCPYRIPGSSLLEADDQFILIFTDESALYVWPIPTADEIETHFKSYENDFRATVLDNNIYMLTNDLEFIYCNIYIIGMSIRMSWLRNKMDFENLLLTSKRSNDDKVILIDKSTRATSLCYNVNTKRWDSIDLKINNKSTSDQKNSNKLLTFTPAFISINVIRQHMSRDLK